MLNKQGPDKIDWTDWSWNPITGCKHGCPYCYMLRMEKRFPGIMKPAFKPEYLDRFKSVRKVKSGDKIFVGSSGDMWGEWVPKEWIHIFFHKAVRHRPDVILSLKIAGLEPPWTAQNEPKTTCHVLSVLLIRKGLNSCLLNPW